MFYISLFLIALAAIPFFYYYKYHKAYGSLISSLVSAGLAFALENISENSESFFTLGAWTILMYIVFMIYCIYDIYVGVKKKQEGEVAEYRLSSQEIGGTNLDKFFVECALSMCNDFSSEKNIAKAKLFAEKYSLSYPAGIEELYRSAYTAHEKINAKIKSNQIDDLRAKEEIEYKELYRYSALYGKEKSIAILTDRIISLKNDTQKQKKYSDSLLQLGQQKESSWSLWGGIVNGLAGPAAGVATAIDIQEKNAKIRAQNAENLKNITPIYNMVISDVRSKESEVNKLEEKIKAIREKLLSEASPKEIFEMLTISSPDINVSESGALKIKATISPKKDLSIFGNTPAVADGTVTAHVFDEREEEIDTIKMVLPFGGVSGKTSIIGMSLSGASKNKKYTVTFSEDVLWLMEK